MIFFYFLEIEWLSDYIIAPEINFLNIEKYINYKENFEV